MTTPPGATPTPALAPAQRKALKARAHALHPVVIIGEKGLSPSVLREIDANLNSHELIKIKATTDDREARAGFLVHICTVLGAQPVQHIGKILVIHRPKPLAEEPAPPANAAKRAPRRAPGLRQASAGRAAAITRAAQPGRTGPGKPGSIRRPR